MNNIVLLEASSRAETLKMVSLIKGGNEGREATSKDCRLTALSTKCEGSSKWILMHKYKVPLNLRGIRGSGKGKTPFRKCLDLIVFVLVVFLS